jgi:hypothetical protein
MLKKLALAVLGVFLTAATALAFLLILAVI